jgi:hypothetical protein
MLWEEQAKDSTIAAQIRAIPLIMIKHTAMINAADYAAQ